MLSCELCALPCAVECWSGCSMGSKRPQLRESCWVWAASFEPALRCQGRSGLFWRARQLRLHLEFMVGESWFEAVFSGSGCASVCVTRRVWKFVNISMWGNLFCSSLLPWTFYIWRESWDPRSLLGSLTVQSYAMRADDCWEGQCRKLELITEAGKWCHSPEELWEKRVTYEISNKVSRSLQVAMPCVQPDINLQLRRIW